MSREIVSITTIENKFTIQENIEMADNSPELMDYGYIDIAYTGLNRNNFVISEETFENSLKTIHGIPVVVNYNIESNTIGEHDELVILNKENKIENIINLTQGIGFVPPNPKLEWVEFKEDNGEIKKYLRTEVFIWKRMMGYDYIKEKEFTNQSMEIHIVTGKIDKDKAFEITEFEWEALCLLEDDIEPCYENAKLDLNFSKLTAKIQMSLEKKKESEKMSGKTNSNLETPVVEPMVEPAVEPIIEPIEDNTKTTSSLETPIVEPVVNETPVEPTQEKSTFALAYEDKKNKLIALLPRVGYDTYKYIIQTFDTYIVYEIYGWNNDKVYFSNFYKVSYTETDGNFTLGDDTVEVFLTYATKEEIDAIDNARTTFALYEEKAIKYDNFILELEKSEKEKIVNKYENICNKEKFSFIKAEVDKLSKDELEVKCKICYADTCLETQTSKTKETFANAPKEENFASTSIDNSDDDGYRGIFSLIK